MKLTQTYELSLEELAAMAVRRGRQLQEAAHAVSLGGNSREWGFASRTLQRLAERDPFDLRDDASLTAVEGIIEADLRTEVLGSERRFIETHYDDLGQHGEVRECPVYSARGAELLAVQMKFRSFMDARSATLDRIAAERAVMRLLAT